MPSSLESDLIVMDRMMPRTDGIEAPDLIKAHPAADAGHPAVRAGLTENVRLPASCGTST
jgi:CheY-like chemotaxis protein